MIQTLHLLVYAVACMVHVKGKFPLCIP